MYCYSSGLRASLLSFFSVYVLAKVSYPDIPFDESTPVQQRIAIYDVNAISVGWNTYGTLPRSCVQYGTTIGNLSSQACSDTATTHLTSRTYYHCVILANLQPATTYFYKIVSTNSTPSQFFSPRTPGDTTPFALNTVSDLGLYGPDGYTLAHDNAPRSLIPSLHPSSNHTTIGRLLSTTATTSYELILHAGDLAYADDWVLKPKNWFHGTAAYEAITEQFYDQLAPVAATKPYMVGPGNHEAACQELPGLRRTCPSSQRNFTDFNYRFGGLMPRAFVSTSMSEQARVLANKARRLARPPFWYSFEYGMVHVVMFDTETDFPHAPDGPHGSTGLNTGPFGELGQQLEFLHADLASVDRHITPWVLVAGHRPWYSTGSRSHRCEPCKAAFEDIFFKYEVDIAVLGHVHNSQRFARMYQGARNEKGPVYIVSGGAGNIEGLNALGSVGKNSGFEFGYDKDFSFASVRFVDRETAEIEFIRSATGEVLDKSVLNKERKDAFVVQGGQ